MSASSSVPPVWPLMVKPSVLLVGLANPLLSIIILPVPPVNDRVVSALSEMNTLEKLLTVADVIVPTFLVPALTSAMPTELTLTPAWETLAVAAAGIAMVTAVVVAPPVT